MSRIAILEARVEELEHNKNSKNSSIPPSKDENRKTKSLRKKSGKKSGGQAGHKGSTLKMCENPDEIIEHDPNYCQCCGHEFEQSVERHLQSIRQVIDIPPIKPIVTEHRSYERQCRNCGQSSRGDFPKEVRSPISYGNNINTLISYFSVRQYIAHNRIKEMMRDIFQVSMSEGTIVNKIARFSESCEWIYQVIKLRLIRSKWSGTDETGYRLNGNKAWMWTWQNDKCTLLYASENRGEQTIREVFPQGLKQSILVHDCWKPHFKVECKTHQLCVAHLLRELQYFVEKRTDQWAYQMMQLLTKAIRLKHKILSEREKDYSKAILNIEEQLNNLVHIQELSSTKKLRSFQKRMRKYQQYIFPFLRYDILPYDNNASERAIRNMKVKMKVSGMFKTKQGAQQFAIIRSVIDTCLKNNQSVFNALSLIPE
ncbi:MAG: IS66 family transposase [Saprospiraceae bacterium]